VAAAVGLSQGVQEERDWYSSYLHSNGKLIFLGILVLQNAFFSLYIYD
jgi:hypothetical protein